MIKLVSFGIYCLPIAQNTVYELPSNFNYKKSKFFVYEEGNIRSIFTVS